MRISVNKRRIPLLLPQMLGLPVYFIECDNIYIKVYKYNNLLYKIRGHGI